MTRLTITLTPTGKARPRERGRLPTRYRNWKKAATLLLISELRRVKWEPATDPHNEIVGVRVVAYHKRPRRRPPWMRHDFQKAAWEMGLPTLRAAKPDCDNLEGAVWDALSDTGRVWVDDTQAVSLGCWQRYAAPGEPSRIEVVLCRLNPASDPAAAFAALEAG